MSSTNAPTTRETADHAELARLAEAATPGPWTNHDALRGEKKSVWVAETAREETERDGVTPSRYGPSRTTICNALASNYSLPSGGYETLDPYPNAAFIAAANPATVLSLLSEIAALRGERTGDDYAAQAEVDEHAGKALDWEIIAGSWKDRATQAERQRDELRKALETARDVLRKHYVDFDGEPEDAVALGRAWAETEQVLANQGADQ